MTEHGHYDFVRLHYDCLKFVRLSSLSVCLKFVRLSEHGHYDFVRLSSLPGGLGVRVSRGEGSRTNIFFAFSPRGKGKPTGIPYT